VSRNRGQHQDGKRNRSGDGREPASQEYDGSVRKYARENRWESRQHLGRKAHYLGQPVAGFRLRQEHGAQESDRHTHRCGQRDDDQGANDSVAESTSLLQRRGRQCSEAHQAQLAASSPQQHPDHGEQWDQRKKRHQRYQSA
jgi:hypothetical protein